MSKKSVKIIHYRQFWYFLLFCILIAFLAAASIQDRHVTNDKQVYPDAALITQIAATRQHWLNYDALTITPSEYSDGITYEEWMHVLDQPAAPTQP